MGGMTMIIKIQNKPVQVELNPEIEQLAMIIQNDEKLLEVIQAFSGATIYIPQKITREIENRRIAAEFDDLIRLPNLSRNKVYLILANRYGKSTRWIREIVGRTSAA